MRILFQDYKKEGEDNDNSLNDLVDKDETDFQKPEKFVLMSNDLLEQSTK